MTLSRTWKDGDTVEIVMPFNLRTEGFRDNPRRIAFMNGPLVLCGEVDEGGNYPAIVSDAENVAVGFELAEDGSSVFGNTAGIFRVAGQNATFIATSDPHYDAFENEDRNDRVRDTLRHMNLIGDVEWPEALSKSA